MCFTCWMQDTGTDIGHMYLQGHHLQAVDETGPGVAAALEREGDDAAAALGQVFFGQCVVGAAFQTAVVHVSHLGVCFQELCHGHAVFAVALHPDMQALQAQVQHVGVHGGLHGAEVAHQLGSSLGDESPLLAKALGVGDAVVAVVRGAQAGELVGVGHPVELAAVHDGTAQHCAVAVHVLGGGMGHDIGTPFNGAAVDGGGKGVIHNQRHTVGVGCIGKLFNIQHRQGRVGNGFAKDSLRLSAAEAGSVNIDKIIARNNIDKYLADIENESIDYYYLKEITGTDSIEEQLRILNEKEEGLSADAKEYLVNLKSSVRTNLRGYKLQYGKNYKPSFAEWNLSKSRVESLLENVDLTDRSMNYENNWK